MCRQSSCGPSSVEQAIAAEESLLIYCKPVELYNILYHRARRHPSFLRRCLRYKIHARRRKRRPRAGIVIFNYRDLSNMIRKTEVTEGFSCPFCLMHCANFKGLRYHLCSSHDLFNFDFWVSEEYQAVNVTVRVDALRSEAVADGFDPRLQMFFFCSKPRRRIIDASVPGAANIKFLELQDLAKDDEFKCTVKNYDGEKSNGSFLNEKSMHDRRHEAEVYGQAEHVASSFSIPNISIANAHSSAEPEAVRSLPGSDPAAALTLSSTKTRKSSADRSDPRNRMLLQKRQFYHSHRVQPMELQQVLSDRDSEDEVDDEIADFEDRRMLDDFVDVTKDEKELMHLWNSFVRKQRVLADGHVPWACEAFSKLHGQMLVVSPPLFWCWRLFMIKLWSHGLLDSATMNNCNMILERYRNEGSGAS